MLKQKLQSELKEAILAQDETKKSVLRMVISAIGYAEINKGGAGYEATDEDVLSVIQKEVKQHRDSIEQFKNANRLELVEKEETELKILETYLPEQMAEDDVRKLVVDAITKSEATNISDIGKVMGILMPQVKGKADGGLVSRLVREELQK